MSIQISIEFLQSLEFGDRIALVDLFQNNCQFRINVDIAGIRAWCFWSGESQSRCGRSGKLCESTQVGKRKGLSKVRIDGSAVLFKKDTNVRITPFMDKVPFSNDLPTASRFQVAFYFWLLL